MNLRFLILTAFVAVPGATFADFVNGSFEDPNLGVAMTQAGYSGSGLTGWSLSGPSEAYTLTNQDAGVADWDATTWYATPNGNQFLYLSSFAAGGEVLSQTVTLGAGSNTLQFQEADFAAQFNYGSWAPGGAVDVEIFNPSNQLVASESFTTADYSNFVGQSLTFSAATAGNYTFAFTSVQNHAGIIDGVTVTPAPEPTTMSFLAGAALFTSWRRKRKRS